MKMGFIKMATDEDKELKPFQILMSGTWKPGFPNPALQEGDFQQLTNMRYTNAPGIKSVLGMSKVNAAAITF